VYTCYVIVFVRNTRFVQSLSRTWKVDTCQSWVRAPSKVIHIPLELPQLIWRHVILIDLRKIPVELCYTLLYLVWLAF